MAIIGCGCSYYGLLVIQASSSIKQNRRNKVSMLHNNHQLPTNKKSTLVIRSSSLQNKIFEDHLRGIICYKNQNGEITCEGYDEGPRFNQQQQHQVPRNPYLERSSEFQIVDILDQEWFQFVQDCGLLLAENSVTTTVVEVEELDSIILDDNLN